VSEDRIYLLHVRDAIADILVYAEAGEDAFLRETMRQDAIIRKLEVIGEAVKQLSDNTRDSRPHIPWRRVAGMRDRLIHQYFGVDLDLVWNVVRLELPALAKAVDDVLSQTPG
jgi:uncharacterized protein with HEPN domain